MIARPISDYATLLQELAALYTAHGVLMVLGGILFGGDGRSCPGPARWTGIMLIVGVSLNLLIALLDVPPIYR